MATPRGIAARQEPESRGVQKLVRTAQSVQIGSDHPGRSPPAATRSRQLFDRMRVDPGHDRKPRQPGMSPASSMGSGANNAEPEQNSQRAVDAGHVRRSGRSGALTHVTILPQLRHRAPPETIGPAPRLVGDHWQAHGRRTRPMLTLLGRNNRGMLRQCAAGPPAGHGSSTREDRCRAGFVGVRESRGGRSVCLGFHAVPGQWARCGGRHWPGEPLAGNGHRSGPTPSRARVDVGGGHRSPPGPGPLSLRPGASRSVIKFAESLPPVRADGQERADGAGLRVPSASHVFHETHQGRARDSGSASADSATACRRPYQSWNSSSMSCFLGEVTVQRGIADPARPGDLDPGLTPDPPRRRKPARRAARIRSRFSRASLRRQRRPPSAGNGDHDPNS